MTAPPFQRIAIFSADLLFPLPIQAMKAQEITARTQDWARVARSKGAQAYYLRFQGEETLFTQVLRALRDQDPGHLILPFSYAHLAESKEGIHFRSSDPLKLPSKESQAAYTSRSCHSLADLQLAETNGFTFAFLSPIFPTRTHPEAQPLGLDYLKNARTQTGIPIFALGGINPDKAPQCLQAGAQGTAGIRMFFS